MEKTWRLQRYNQKNYSELVEFPVEIIGRDGKVRRYTFEDSIRLYRRRITFAPIRYRDTDLIQAEVEHCRSRIDQLRRSYFFRFGWGVQDGEPGPVELFGSIAGELAAFLCRVLRIDGRPEVRVEAVQDMFEPVPALELASKAISAWYVAAKGGTAGMLLYVHRFDGARQEDVREGFFGRVKELERAGPVQGDGERLLAFHHTIDCGFILTARGEDFEALNIAQDDEEEVIAEPTAWDDALDALRHGNASEGLGRCRQIVAEQPFHRQAYIAGAAAAIHLDQGEVAEDFALVGSKYFKGEPLLHYYLGLARARQGRTADAIIDLQRAVDAAAGLHSARLLLALLLLRSRRTWAGRRVVARTPADRGDDKRSHQALQALGQALLVRTSTVSIGYSAVIIGLLVTALAGWFGLVLVAFGLVAAALGLGWFDRELARRAGWERYDDISTVVRRLRRASGEDAP